MPARVALSCPVINTLTHPAVVGPVLATNALDLQDFAELEASANHSLALVGPPTVSIEVKLLGVDDTSIEEAGDDPTGTLIVRGPPVTKLLTGDELDTTSASGYVNVHGGESVSPGDDEDGWTNLGVRVKVHTNGSFRVVA